MASSTSTSLSITAREAASSRETRRLRRGGKVPGVLYGQGKSPVAFAVDARELRNALVSSGAVLELSMDGTTQPAVLKESQKHPVRGEITHVDLLRVDLNQKIVSTVPVEISGEEEAPGVVEGGVLSFLLREVDVEALPADIPESLSYDVSKMEIGDSATVAELATPANVELVLDDTLEEQPTLVTVTPPTLEPEPDEELETETELVGEDGEPIVAEGADEDGSDEAGEPDSSDSDS